MFKLMVVFIYILIKMNRLLTKTVDKVTVM